MNTAETHGVYKTCQTCGRVFYVIYPDQWVYKEPVRMNGQNRMLYFHTYSCKRKFEETRKAASKNERKASVDRMRSVKKPSHIKKEYLDKHCAECRYCAKGKYGFYDCTVYSMAINTTKYACGRFKPKYKEQANGEEMNVQRG